MNFVVAIPSYSRSDIITKKTLRVCQEMGFDFSKIFVFVVDSQFCSYKNSIKNEQINIITGGPIGLHNMRNFITDYFEEGTSILHMDDDIDTIFKFTIDETITDLKKSARYKLIPITSIEFMQTIENAFSLCIEKGIGLFGIYPVANGYFMKGLPSITFDIRFCVGVMWGTINSKNIKINIEEKEDFERTLLFYERDSSVMRLNNITVKTKYYKTAGGMQSRETNRIETSKQSCEYLLNRFPKWTKLYTGKKSNIHEVRLTNLPVIHLE
jgi:hypothetical protein